MAGLADDHTHGEMDIAEHAYTFHHFLVATKWGSLAIAVGVLFLTMWFCTNAGFLGAAFANNEQQNQNDNQQHKKRSAHHAH